MCIFWPQVSPCNFGNQNPVCSADPIADDCSGFERQRDRASHALNLEHWRMLCPSRLEVDSKESALIAAANSSRTSTARYPQNERRRGVCAGQLECLLHDFDLPLTTPPSGAIDSNLISGNGLDREDEFERQPQWFQTFRLLLERWEKPETL